MTTTKKQIQIVEISHKTCRDCGKLKRIDQFYGAKTKDGHRATCKACHKRQVIQCRKAKSPPPERTQEGWRLVYAINDGGEGLSVYVRGPVIKYDQMAGMTKTRSTRFALALDDSGKSYESEAMALKALG